MLQFFLLLNLHKSLILQMRKPKVIIARIIIPLPPKKIYILIPGTCDYAVTWQRGMKVADGINIDDQLTFRWEDFPRLPRWAQCNHKDSLKMEGRDNYQGNKRARMWEGFNLPLLILEIERAIS